MKRQVLRTGLFMAVALTGVALLWPDPSQAVQKEKKQPKVFAVPGGDGLKIESELKADDPKDKVKKESHRKVFLVKMAVGRNSLPMNAKDQDDLDAFLHVEDAAGKELADNDDAPDENTLNARIDFQCDKNGTYRIISPVLTRANRRIHSAHPTSQVMEFFQKKPKRTFFLYTSHTFNQGGVFLCTGKNDRRLAYPEFRP